VYELRPYQREAVDSLFNYFAEHDGNPILTLPTGCHGAGTKIIAYNGHLINVEDVCVGDLVMGPDSQPRTVLSLCRGKSDMYKITPHSGGGSFTVNGEHVLSLISTNEGKSYPCSFTGIERTEITVNEYLTKSIQPIRSIFAWI
jgi:hypothetical protein